MEKKKILVFTGAGISQESGVSTFRNGKNALWNDFKVEEVASIEGWNVDPLKVLEFYNLRRKEMATVVPNSAHIDIAKLEEYFDVRVVTQNVDDLHERAGSTNIIHLHGQLNSMRSSGDPEYKADYVNDLKIGDLCPNGHQMRPDIVWFGEELNPLDLYKTQMAAEDVDVCIIVGTTMQVSPANGIPWLTPELTLVYYIDPGEADFRVPKFRTKAKLFTHVKKKATEGVPEVIDEIKRIYKV